MFWSFNLWQLFLIADAVLSMLYISCYHTEGHLLLKHKIIVQFLCVSNSFSVLHISIFKLICAAVYLRFGFFILSLYGYTSHSFYLVHPAPIYAWVLHAYTFSAFIISFTGKHQTTSNYIKRFGATDINVALEQSICTEGVTRTARQVHRTFGWN